VANICNPLFGRRKEMKNSTVVPDVAGRWFALNLGDVCGDPTDPFGSLAQSLLGNLRLPVCFRIHDSALRLPAVIARRRRFFPSGIMAEMCHSRLVGCL